MKRFSVSVFIHQRCDPGAQTHIIKVNKGKILGKLPR